MASSDLKGKSLVIIGGTTGLGLSAARAFLEQGARIVVTGRNPVNVKKAQKEFGKSARCFSADAIRSTSAARAIGIALREFNGFHGLYHVAGGSGRKAGDGRKSCPQPRHTALHQNQATTRRWPHRASRRLRCCRGLFHE